MALWILFTILAVLVWAIGGIIDKFIFTKWIVKPIIPVIVINGTVLLASIIIYLNKGFTDLSSINIFLSILAGVCYVLSYFCIIKR